MKPIEQFRIFIVRWVLQHLGLHSQAAEDLVVGTAVHESGGLRFFEQVTGKGDRELGPALGFFQVELATHDDLHQRFLVYRPDLRRKLLELMPERPGAKLQLAGNTFYGAAVCRLIYYRCPEALPAAGDIDGYARYWKQHYNTWRGKGDPADWIAHYRAAHQET